MTDINQIDSTENEGSDTSADLESKKSGSSRISKVLICIISIVGLFGVLFFTGIVDQGASIATGWFPALKDNHWFKEARGVFSSNREPLEMAAVFKRYYPDDLFTEHALLAIVGQSPSEPSKVLFKTFSQTVAKDENKDQESCAADGEASETISEKSQTVSETPIITGIDQSQPVAEDPSGEDNTQGVDDDLATLLAKTAPKPVETRIINSRGPDEEPAASGDDKGRSGASESESTDNRSTDKRSLVQNKAPSNEQKEEKVSVPGEDPDDPTPKESDIPSNAQVQTKSVKSDESMEKRDSQNIADNPEKFKVPGSLKVSISGYSGASAKWALMFVLDDSAAMGREIKPWRPNRIKSAAEFIELISTNTPKGSKLAVRDFYCSARNKRRNRTSPLCLSHMLYDWAVYPYEALKGNLEKVNPIGRTNPCAAAAFTLKRDFRNLGDLRPRVAIITSGMTRCRVSEVLRIINTKWAAKKPQVDVIGFGLSRRAARNYSVLAKKTNGAMLSIDTPDETKNAAKKYEKALDKRVTGKIQIKGQSSGFKVAPDEEITLAPGSYAIVLPEVKGLTESERTIGSVKIRSGKTSKVMVRLRRGKLSYKTAIN